MYMVTLTLGDIVPFAVKATDKTDADTRHIMDDEAVWVGRHFFA